MPDQPTDIDRRSDRRTFIKQGLFSAGALALGGTGSRAGRGSTGHRSRHAVQRQHQPRHRPPNILVVLVDQLRTPIWMPAGVLPAALMPNLSALQRGAVNFERHYTASNDCSPSRGALLTGLYSHQTGCMITGNSHLDPGFPTWGTLLRERGYETAWWGKWHLNPDPNASLEPYGFAGGTYPSPNGAPGQGTAVDPEIAAQFAEWFREAGGVQPWCTTVSFVNPHDVAWWYRFTSKISLESSPSGLTSALPPNFETPEMLEAQRKPRLQRSLQDTADRSFGSVPYGGPEMIPMWTGLMDTYLMLQSYVDQQIGSVLRTLASQPAVLANTVVLFTSDHGEYGGSHGLRGKGASAYEEAIRVPLSVRDFRPRHRAATAASGIARTQLTSSVAVAGLLLSLATGSERWRRERHYEHLAARQDLAAICAHPGAAGRDWILHATDEDVTGVRRANPTPPKRPGTWSPCATLAASSRSTPTGARKRPSWKSPARNSSYTTTANSPGARSWPTAPARRGPWKRNCGARWKPRALPGELRASTAPRTCSPRSGAELANYASVEEFENLKVYATRQDETPLTPEAQATPRPVEPTWSPAKVHSAPRRAAGPSYRWVRSRRWSPRGRRSRSRPSRRCARCSRSRRAFRWRSRWSRSAACPSRGSGAQRRASRCSAA